MAPPEGLEPPTTRFEAEYSNPLSYGGKSRTLAGHFNTKIIYYLCMLNKDLRKKLSFLYVVLILATGAFVWYSLNLEPIQVREKSSSKKVMEVKPAKVTLRLENGEFYTKRMENTDSVLDLMESLRDDTDFIFEKTAYIYDTEIEHVNHMYPEEGEYWSVLLEGVDITARIGDTYLINGLVYDLKLAHDLRSHQDL